MQKQLLKFFLPVFTTFLLACGSSKTDTTANSPQAESLAADSATIAEVKDMTTTAAEDPSKRPSPPAVAEGEINGVKIRVDYSQPSVKGREVWGKLVEYNKVWRTGANEATTIAFDKDVLIEGQKLKAGKYALFTIPTATEWTVIFNTRHTQWGAFDYNAQEDALSVKVKPTTNEPTEKMLFKVENDNVSLSWERLKVSFKVAKQ